MPRKAKAAEATEAPKKTAHDIAGDLAAMLNGSAKQEANTGEVEAPVKKAASRSNFSGELVIPNPSGGVLSVIPIKTFVATDEDKVERNMFHGTHTVEVKNDKGEVTGTETKTCLGGLRQAAMTCSDCNTTVDKTAAQKGVRVGEKVVFISDDELKAQQPLRDGKMKILEYIDESEINPIFYEGTEFVAPDGSAPVLTAFAALRDGLKRTGKVAKGVRIKGGREQYFTLRPYGQYGMTMHYLYADYEVRSCDKWTPIAVPEALVQLFAQMIEVTSVPFTPAPQDTFLMNVRRLIKQKSAGVEVETPKPEADAAPADDLVSALEKALAAAKCQKKAATN